MTTRWWGAAAVVLVGVVLGAATPASAAGGCLTIVLCPTEEPPATTTSTTAVTTTTTAPPPPVTVTTTAPVPTSAAAAARLLDLVNRERRAAGLAPLVLREDVRTLAQGWSAHLAAAGALSHDDGYFTADTRHRLDARALGENVAYAGDADQAHAALMASPHHRDNVLDPRFGVIGIGAVHANGLWWFTQRFVQPGGSSAAPAPTVTTTIVDASPPPPPVELAIDVLAAADPSPAPMAIAPSHSNPQRLVLRADRPHAAPDTDPSTTTAPWPLVAAALVVLVAAALGGTTRSAISGRAGRI